MKEMKDKIKASLQQGYKNLGLSDEVFERVAQAAQTFITEDAQIEPFVSGAKPMLQMYQSLTDKVRTELSAKIKGLEEDKAALEARLGKDKKTPENPANERKEEQPGNADIAKIVADAVAQAVAPLQTKLVDFESAAAQKSAVATALGRIEAWDYAKAYPKECKRAQENALELYEAYGKTWTADEIEAKIKEKFSAEVYDRGIDTTKPLEGDGEANNSQTRFAAMAKRQQERLNGTGS
nr:MAG TPA: hypothetical protein [Bacteriophage sp.]